MGKIDLSIIYVNFNSTDPLLASIESVKKYAPDFSYEIFVVDNDSKKEEIEKLIFSFPHSDGQIQIIKQPKNTGFGAANNLASKKASGQFLLFLNPDTLVVDDSISKMTEYLGNHQEVGMLSPLLYNLSGQLQKHFYADNLSLAGITFERWKGRQIDLKKPAATVGMVSGAAMMTRRELFERIGGFDEKFFMYQEDDDLCLRFQQAGFKNVVLTSAKVIHLEGQSSIGQDKKKWYYQSQNYYFRKHYGWLSMMVMRALRLPYILYQRLGR